MEKKLASNLFNLVEPEFLTFLFKARGPNSWVNDQRVAARPLSDRPCQTTLVIEVVNVLKNKWDLKSASNPPHSNRDGMRVCGFKQWKFFAHVIDQSLGLSSKTIARKHRFVCNMASQIWYRWFSSHTCLGAEGNSSSYLINGSDAVVRNSLSLPWRFDQAPASPNHHEPTTLTLNDLVQVIAHSSWAGATVHH